MNGGSTFYLIYSPPRVQNLASRLMTPAITCACNCGRAYTAAPDPAVRSRQLFLFLSYAIAHGPEPHHQSPHAHPRNP